MTVHTFETRHRDWAHLARRFAAPLACVAALVAVACVGEEESPEDAEVGQVQLASTQQAVRQSADGENIRASVPTLAPSVEVGKGGKCGVQNAQGAYLTCQPGMACLSAAEGQPGTCHALERVQRLDEHR